VHPPQIGLEVADRLDVISCGARDLFLVVSVRSTEALGNEKACSARQSRHTGKPPSFSIREEE
jgi:hypothetical protein